MASAIFVVPVVDGNPDLSPDQFLYDDDDTLRGGYSCVEFVTGNPACTVQVWCSAEQLDALVEDGRYQLVEVVDE